jgi:hypothetical protein
MSAGFDAIHSSRYVMHRAPAAKLRAVQGAIPDLEMGDFSFGTGNGGAAGAPPLGGAAHGAAPPGTAMHKQVDPRTPANGWRLALGVRAGSTPRLFQVLAQTDWGGGRPSTCLTVNSARERRALPARRAAGRCELSSWASSACALARSTQS